MYIFVLFFLVEIACFNLNDFRSGCKYINVCIHIICMCMHAYMCVHTWMSIYQHVHECACVHVYVHAYVRVCTFCNTLPHTEVGLAGFAHPPYWKASYAYVTCISSRETPFLNIGKSHLQPAHNRPIGPPSARQRNKHFNGVPLAGR